MADSPTTTGIDPQRIMQPAVSPAARPTGGGGDLFANNPGLLALLGGGGLGSVGQAAGMGTGAATGLNAVTSQVQMPGMAARDSGQGTPGTPPAGPGGGQMDIMQLLQMIFGSLGGAGGGAGVQGLLGGGQADIMGQLRSKLGI